MKFLIIKTSSLGDIIHSLGITVRLKSVFKDAQIDWVVEKPFAEIVQKFSAISEVYTINTKKWRKNLFKLSTWKDLNNSRKSIKQKSYDAVIDLQGNVKSACVLAQVNARHKVGFGFKTVSEWPNIFFTNRRFDPPAGKNVRDEYQFVVDAYLKKHFPEAFYSSENILEVIDFQINVEESATIENILTDPRIQNRFKILICPGSNWINKQLPYETLLAFLQKIEKFKSECGFLFAWGNDKEKLIAERLSDHFQKNGKVIDRLSLPLFQNLMKKVQLVIAMDSLPLHLCATTETLSFGIFGPSLASKYAPVGANHETIQGTCPYGRTFERRCPILRTCPTGQCMRDLDAEILFKKLLPKLRVS